MAVVVAGPHVARRGRAMPPLKRFSSARRIRMVLDIFQVHLRLLLRTFLRSLPVAAELVVDHIVGGQVGPSSMRKLLFDLLHLVLVHLLAKVILLFVSGGQSRGVGLLQLPANVRRVPHRPPIHGDCGNISTTRR